MGQVIRLDDYQERHAPPAPRAEAPDEYYCSRCGGATFKLLTDGSIACSRCRARMNNLRVAPEAAR